MSPESDYECVTGVYEELDSGDRWCDCGVECEEIDHDVWVRAAGFVNHIKKIRKNEYELQFPAKNEDLHLRLPLHRVRDLRPERLRV